MTRLVSVDPGGVHVGVATFQREDSAGWSCTWAGEMTPVQFEDWLTDQVRYDLVDILVVEEWRLFADKAVQQVGSKMETSQLIGAIKYICRTLAGEGLVVSWQQPSIKNPTRSVVKSRSLRSMADELKVPGDHARDAELHGYYYILKKIEEQIVD